VASTCPGFSHPRLAAGPAIDLGGGVVGQEQARNGRVVGSENVFAEAIYLFFDCNEGSGAWLRTYGEEPEGTVNYDVRDAAASVIDTALSASEPQSFSDFLETVRSAGIAVDDIRALGIETCLCAEVYPQMRGDKVPFEDVK
jgi:hypothetical protein